MTRGAGAQNRGWPDLPTEPGTLFLQAHKSGAPGNTGMWKSGVSEPQPNSREMCAAATSVKQVALQVLLPSPPWTPVPL